MEERVIGTVRNSDNTISHLVLESRKAIDMEESIKRAIKRELYVLVNFKRVYVIPVDQDGDGVYDYVKTEADGYYENNLLALPVFSLV